LLGFGDRAEMRLIDRAGALVNHGLPRSVGFARRRLTGGKTMTNEQPQPQAIKPTWRKVTEFPLVAMVIAIALVVGTIQLTSFVFHFIPKTGISPRTREITGSLVVVAMVVAVYKLAIRRLGEHPRDDLRSEHAGRDLGLGLLGGTLIFSAVTAVAGLVGVYHIVGPGNANDIFYAAVTMGLVPAVMEETLFRGILFRHLEDFGGTWFALALTSALFGLAHIFNPNATYFSSFAIAVEAGIMLGGAYMLTRSLWLAMGLHAAWNFTQGEIYDVPVSGIDQHGLVDELIVLDIDAPAFRDGLERLRLLNKRIGAAKAQGGFTGGLKRAGLTAAAGLTFVSLYFSRTEANALPAAVRMAPAW